MPTEAISCGPPTTILQNVVWALPAAQCHLIANAVCEFSLDGSAWTSVAASTTGMTNAWAFIRCTTGNAIVACKRQ